MSHFAFKNSAGLEAAAADYLFKLSSPDVKIPEDKQEKHRRFEGVGYTGDPITEHPYWGTVIFDLSQMNVPKKMPILLNHYTDRIVGFSDKYGITDKGLELEGHLTKSTSFGQEVIALSDEGFPWQMSVRIHPSIIEEVKAGATAVVNGRTVHGPAYIFRKSKIAETSFTPTGWDDGTSATALSRVISNEEDTQMSKELEDKVKELTDKVTSLSASVESITKERDDLKTQVEAFAKTKLEEKKTSIKEAFAAAGKELDEATLNAFSAMPDDMVKTMLAFAAKPVEEKKPEEKKPELPENLFEHQATKGAETTKVEDAAGKGLVALCTKEAETYAKSLK